MFKSSLLILTIAVLTTSAFLAHSQNAYAVESQACIFVYPCMEGGEIDPKYDVEGYCGDLWRSQCISREEVLRACEKQVDFSEVYITSLQKKVNKLERKLARSRRK